MTQVLYDEDFYAWTKQQASLLQAEVIEGLDLANLAEEIEAMGKGQCRELGSRLTVLLIHLLKLHFYQRQHVKNWRSAIHTQRGEIELALRNSPSLRLVLPDAIFYAYRQACWDVARENQVAQAKFKADCPWTVEQILDED